MAKIDFSAYEGREQAFIKHTLLEQYLPEWGFKVGSAWDSLVYVDGFAGPWDVQSPNFDDSSFGIASKALSQVARGFTERGKHLNVKCVLVEENQEAFKKLKIYADSVNRVGFGVEALGGQFVTQLPTIHKIIREAGESAFRFVFLDPKGWNDMPMSEIRPLLNVRGSEVVVNLMTRHMLRFLEQPDRAESFRNLFGREDVLEVLDGTPASEKHDALVREYGKSLHQLCGYKYVSSAVILEPKRNDIRYFLVYGTNHHRGIEVFKAAETKAARLQDRIRHEVAVQKSGGQDDMLGSLFGEAPTSDYAFSLWQRYCDKAQRKIIGRILDASPGGVAFAELFCDAMAFPLVTPSDLHGWLTKWHGAIEVCMAGNGRKKPSPDHDDRVVVRSASLLRGFL